jgi:hypothetical protein
MIPPRLGTESLHPSQHHRRCLVHAPPTGGGGTTAEGGRGGGDLSVSRLRSSRSSVFFHGHGCSPLAIRRALDGAHWPETSLNPAICVPAAPPFCAWSEADRGGTARGLWCCGKTDTGGGAERGHGVGGENFNARHHVSSLSKARTLQPLTCTRFTRATSASAPTAPW